LIRTRGKRDAAASGFVHNFICAANVEGIVDLETLRAGIYLEGIRKSSAGNPDNISGRRSSHFDADVLTACTRPAHFVGFEDQAHKPAVYSAEVHAHAGILGIPESNL
jgi:hypothetical protein